MCVADTQKVQKVVVPLNLCENYCAILTKIAHLHIVCDFNLCNDSKG